MKTKTSEKTIYFGLAAAVLALLVLITAVLVINVAVPVSEGRKSDMVICITTGEPGLANFTTNAEEQLSSVTAELGNGEFHVFDMQGSWSTHSKLNIFEHNDPRVKSDGTGSADHVIAPGTSNKYVFSLKNDKPQGVIYRLEVTGDNDSEYKIPVKVRLRDLSGKNTDTDFTDIEELNLTQGGAISANSERSYQIDWEWAYDGDDEYDTMLGNTAVNEEIPCHININVVAEYGDLPVEDSEGPNPSEPDVTTGDYTNAAPFIITICLSATLAAFVIVFRKRRKGNV